MKKIYLITLIFCFPFFVKAQQRKSTIVYTSDIDNFWIAFDSVHTTIDTLKQVQFIQQLYIDKGTPGLHAFMKARNYDAKLWIKVINKFPKFWASIRSNTLQVKDEVYAINKSIDRFKELYPEMKPAKMYFTVGAFRSGGTTTDDMVLVGTEIATADKYTDASELDNWLKGVFQNQDRSNLVYLNVHEYVHTQQNQGAKTLLAQCITEGSADFIAELVTQKKINNAYTVYGRQHEAELKEKFSNEMFTMAIKNWLYNGVNVPHADLGYFMGYVICNAYYNNAPNKKQAIKDIIELNYADNQQVFNFLKQSGYYTDTVKLQALLNKFEALRPQVVSLYPDVNLKQNVPSTLTELTINFSEPMGKDSSIATGEGDNDLYPIVGVIGFSDDRKSFKVKLLLQTNKIYDFIITGLGFESQTGYPLKEYKVHFRVK